MPHPSENSHTTVAARPGLSGLLVQGPMTMMRMTMGRGVLNLLLTQPPPTALAAVAVAVCQARACPTPFSNAS